MNETKQKASVNESRLMDSNLFLKKLNELPICRYLMEPTLAPLEHPLNSVRERTPRPPPDPIETVPISRQARHARREWDQRSSSSRGQALRRPKCVSTIVAHRADDDESSSSSEEELASFHTADDSFRSMTCEDEIPASKPQPGQYVEDLKKNIVVQCPNGKKELVCVHDLLSWLDFLKHKVDSGRLQRLNGVEMTPVVAKKVLLQGDICHCIKKAIDHSHNNPSPNSQKHAAMMLNFFSLCVEKCGQSDIRTYFNLQQQFTRYINTLSQIFLLCQPSSELTPEMEQQLTRVLGDQLPGSVVGAIRNDSIILDEYVRAFQTALNCQNEIPDSCILFRKHGNAFEGETQIQIKKDGRLVDLRDCVEGRSCNLESSFKPFENIPLQPLIIKRIFRSGYVLAYTKLPAHIEQDLLFLEKMINKAGTVRAENVKIGELTAIDIEKVAEGDYSNSNVVRWNRGIVLELNREIGIATVYLCDTGDVVGVKRENLVRVDRESIVWKEPPFLRFVKIQLEGLVQCREKNLVIAASRAITNIMGNGTKWNELFLKLRNFVTPLKMKVGLMYMLNSCVKETIEAALQISEAIYIQLQKEHRGHSRPIRDGYEDPTELCLILLRIIGSPHSTSITEKALNILNACMELYPDVPAAFQLFQDERCMSLLRDIVKDPRSTESLRNTVLKIMKKEQRVDDQDVRRKHSMPVERGDRFIERTQGRDYPIQIRPRGAMNRPQRNDYQKDLTRDVRVENRFSKRQMSLAEINGSAMDDIEQNSDPEAEQAVKQPIVDKSELLRLEKKVSTFHFDHRFNRALPVGLIDCQDSRSIDSSTIGRYLCAYLNSVKGGSVVIGVTGTRLIKGMRLNRKQRDEITQCIDSICKDQIYPKVVDERVSVTFPKVIRDRHVPDDCEYNLIDIHIAEGRINKTLLRFKGKVWAIIDNKLREPNANELKRMELAFIEKQAA